MKNCHKRWKRKQKEKAQAMHESNERSSAKVTQWLNDMTLFFKKHPDQAKYEVERHQKGESTVLKIDDISSDKPSPPVIPTRW